MRKDSQVKDFSPKTNPNPKPTRPILRYHGGKWRIAPWITSFFPDHDRYVEPFGGAASVLLRKEPCNHEVYNDLDDELVNLFRVLRERGPELIEQLRLTPYSRTEFDRAFQPCEDPLEQARRAVFRSAAGFGTAGFNRKTGFSVAAKTRTGGRTYEWINLAEAVPAIVTRLKTVIIENRPALDVMKYHDSERTLFYVDPPYMLCTRDAGSDYKHEMTDDDHQQLGECVRSLKGQVILNGYDSPLYADMFSGWKKHTRETRCQSLASRTECLWIKP